MKKYIYLLFLISLPVGVVAQQEGTFYFMNTISQSTYYNPAFTPKYGTTVGLPAISSNYVSGFNSGFAYKDLISRREEDDSLVVTVDNFYKALKDRNYIQAQGMIDLFHLAFNLNPRMHVTLNVTEKNYMNFDYPKDIATLLINGNTPFIGEDKLLSFKMHGLAYIESGMGLNYKINEMITAGARFKVLKGLGNAYTERADLTVNTGDNYQIEVRGDVLMHTAGLDSEIEELSDITQMLSNNGFAVDLGVSVKPLDKLSLGLSVTDLGGITWKNEVKTYSLDPETADFSFKGIDIENLFEDEDSFEAELDSLEQKFELTEAEGGSYRTSLPPTIFLSGSYELARQLYASLLISGRKNPGAMNMSATANITKNVGKALSLGLSYTTNKNSHNNWGAGVSFNLAPLQIYFAGDNILGAASSTAFKKEINPFLNNMQYFNFRFGVNFIGAWEKTAEKLSDDSF